MTLASCAPTYVSHVIPSITFISFKVNEIELCLDIFLRGGLMYVVACMLHSFHPFFKDELSFFGKFLKTHELIASVSE